MEGIRIFINKLLESGNFRSSEIPSKYYGELLTEFKKLKDNDVVMIPSLIKLCKGLSVKLIVDDTNNPKYGLKNYVRTLKNLKTSGYHKGYKIVLFLCEIADHRIPIGFALWHKDSPSPNDLAMAGFSRLRNHFDFKPDVILADGSYSADKVEKQLTDYGWRFVFRWRKSRNLGGDKITKQIPRGYGSFQGYLENGVKVKVFRREKRFYISNRMLWDMKKIVKLYKKRWTIEEVFKILKSQIGINRCQQHSLKSQELFLWMCMIAFSYLERTSKDIGNSIYKTKSNVIFQNVNIDNSILKEVFAMR